jgi:hypothetical protein
MFVLRRFTPGQHRCDARISAGEDLGPLIAGLVRKLLSEQLVHFRESCRVELIRYVVGGQDNPRPASSCAKNCGSIAPTAMYLPSAVS